MKKRKAKAKEVKQETANVQEEICAEELPHKEETKRVSPFSAWDNLLFIRRPHLENQSEESTDTSEEKSETEEKSERDRRNHGWFWF